MSLRHPFCAATVCFLAFSFWSSAQGVITTKQPVTNHYGSTIVVDSYQWLESASNPKVKDWTRKENARTRAYFSKLAYREGIAQQLMQIRTEESARFIGLAERRGRIFSLRFKAPAQQPVLVRLSSLNPPALWRPVLDPNTRNTNGTTTIDWFVPSPDGKLVAVSLSDGGSEQGTLHFFDTDTGKELQDYVPRVQYPTGGGSAAWLADSSGVLYTRYPHKGEKPDDDINFYQQVWLHKIGTPESEDKYETGRDFPKIAEVSLEKAENSGWIVATVANGDGGDFKHLVRNPDGKWTQITRFEDSIKAAKPGRDNALYLMSTRNAPRGKVLRLTLDSPELSNAKVVIPEQKGVVQEIAPDDDGLYITELIGGPSALYHFRNGSTHGKEIQTLPISSAGGIQSWRGSDLVYGNVSYLKPFAYYTYDAKENKSRRTAIATTSPVDFDDMEVVREFATSKDGTKVPVNIIMKKGTKLNGDNPAVLYGYGGYGISLSPSFDPTRRIWFDAGGIYVIANLRGGGEYGEMWHKAGNLTKKQNVFDDFIACAEHLIKRGYTNPKKLAVEGGSNGGLLMGAILTQRPDLMRAVVSRVGIYDMLRVELDPNGQFNITEFGTVKNPAQFRALYDYSPYHHVKNGLKYPAVLLTTGENDGRVNPAQSRKMAARLQEATTSGYPILFRSSASAGHGMGTALSERIAEQSDILSFLFDQLGMNGKPWIF
jgi:prolyl oligopeptidase